MTSKTAERLHADLTAPASAEARKTVTIKGKTVEIVDKYRKGRNYGEAVAMLIAMADEFYAEFAQTKDSRGA